MNTKIFGNIKSSYFKQNPSKRYTIQFNRVSSKNNKIGVIILKKKKINPIKEHCVRKILCMSKSNISTDMYV